MLEIVPLSYFIFIVESYHHLNFMFLNSAVVYLITHCCRHLTITFFTDGKWWRIYVICWWAVKPLEEVTNDLRNAVFVGLCGLV